MLEIVYLPERDNTLADALSHEERRTRETPKRDNLDVYLGWGGGGGGGVEGQPPHEREERVGAPAPAEVPKWETWKRST